MVEREGGGVRGDYRRAILSPNCRGLGEGGGGGLAHLE